MISPTDSGSCVPSQAPEDILFRALKRTAGALRLSVNLGRIPESSPITFTGEFTHLGGGSFGGILDEADAALAMLAARPEAGAAIHQPSYAAGYEQGAFDASQEEPVAVPVSEERLKWFLTILESVGGKSDASDAKWCWTNAFCDDVPNPTDTFNRAIELGFTTTSHDSDSDASMVYLAARGRSALTRFTAALAVPDKGVQGDQGDSRDPGQPGSGSQPEADVSATAALASARDVRSVLAWLQGLPSLDMEDIAADGGVTVAMVVQQESVEMAARLQRVLCKDRGNRAPAFR